MIEIDVDARRPNFQAQLVPSDHFTGTLQQQQENLVRLLLQADAAPFLTQLVRTVVQFEDTESERPRDNCGLVHGGFP